MMVAVIGLKKNLSGIRLPSLIISMFLRRLEIPVEISAWKIYN